MESTDYIRDMRDLVPGATIVHLAVENRDIEKINNASKDLLIRCDRDGESPLHYAAVNDDLEMCKLLLSKNPDLLNIKCIEGKTALDWAKEYYAEYNSHSDIINFLENLF
jgi:ankyrin repeat protein